MAEYIERKAVINDIGELFTLCNETLPNAEGHHFIVESELQTHLDHVKSLPAADVVPVVRCRECIHRPSGTGVNHNIEFPDRVCPCQCLGDPWYSWMPRDVWYCASGERKDGGQDE